MPVMVKSIILWRKEIENKAGVLASTLEPLAKGGGDLELVMSYRYPGNESKSAIELYPIAGKKLVAAAEAAQLRGSSIPTLLVQGDDRPGLGHAIAEAIARARINLAFFVAQVIDRRYSAVLGFETETEAKKAAPLIRRATAGKRRR